MSRQRHSWAWRTLALRQRQSAAQAARALAEVLEPRQLLSGSEYLVNSLSDAVAADEQLTLREAIQAANTNAPVNEAPAGSPTDTDIIRFDPALFASGPATLRLGGAELRITDRLSILGPGSDQLAIDANGRSRIFNISAQAALTNLTMTGGSAPDGGAIYGDRASSIVLSSCTLVGNSAANEGGGIYGVSGSSITLVDSRISGNAAASGGGISAHGTPALASAQQMTDWGLAVYQETLARLGLGGGQFAETATLSGARSGGDSGHAYVWPMATQFRVQDSLAQLDPAAYTAPLLQFSDALRSLYWDARGGYRSGLSPGATRFYDDNGHIAVALAEAYQLTHNPAYLARARETYSFVISGEDSLGGGGIYFSEWDHSSKDAISTLQGARAAAMLYRATGETRYLADATRLRAWAMSHIQQSGGLFWQGYNLASHAPSGVELVNAAGIGISLNLELYKATSEATYLAEAQRIASSALPRYFDAGTGRINDEGYWAFELVDALDDLYLCDGNAKWANAVNQAMLWLHQNKPDPNGHYGLFWGRDGQQTSTLSSWNLNDQAAVARAYLHTGLCAGGGAEFSLANCIISGNSASLRGGGMYNLASSPTLTHCTFSGNAGGMYNSSSSPTLANCILWFDTLRGNAELLNAGSSTPQITYSNVQAAVAGVGNLLLPPWFVRMPGAGPDGRWGTADDDYGDLRLRSTSPCINAGSNALAVDASGNPLTSDVAGQPRIAGGTVDMGAFEYPPQVFSVGGLGVNDAIELTSDAGSFFYSINGSSPTVRMPRSLVTAIRIDAQGGDTLSFDLDLQATDLLIQSDPASRDQLLASISQAIASRSLRTSQADDLHGLAAILNQDSQGKRLYDTFAGTSADESSVLVKLTWNGDADLNGILDGSDYFFIDKGYLSRNLPNPPAGYGNGDFNYDGQIDGSDYFLIDKAFLSQRSTGAAQAQPAAQAAAAAPQRPPVLGKLQKILQRCTPMHARRHA